MNSEPQSPPTNWQRTLYVLSFTQLVTTIGFSSIFPFLPLYVKSLGSSMGLSIELLAGLVFSGQAFTMMLASPVWGALADRFGRKLMIQRASFGGAVLLLSMAFVQSGEQLVALRTIQGLITGTMAANNALTAAVVPRKRSGYAMGMLMVAAGSGFAIGPLLGGVLADAFGYRAAFYGTAALLFTAGVSVTFGVREDFDPQKAQQAHPNGFFHEWGEIFSTPGVVSTYVMRFLSQLGRMMPIPLIPFFIETLTIGTSATNTFIGLVMGISAGATTFSSVYLGRLGDRVGHRKILVGGLLAAGALYLPQSLVSHGWQILALQALTGVAIGGVIPSISALLANYTRPGQEGAVYGLDNSINAGSRAVAPLAGSAVAASFALPAVFVATGLTYFLAAVLAATILPQPNPEEEPTITDEP